MAISDSPFLPSLADHTSLVNDRKSILRYQRFHKLPATGVIDKRTANYMRGNNTRVVDRITEDDPRWNPATMGNKRGSTGPSRVSKRPPLY